MEGKLYMVFNIFTDKHPKCVPLLEFSPLHTDPKLDPGRPTVCRNRPIDTITYCHNSVQKQMFCEDISVIEIVYDV